MPPVDRGQYLADLHVYCDENLIQKTPLYAADTVEQGDLVRQATDALKELTLGWLN